MDKIIILPVTFTIQLTKTTKKNTPERPFDILAQMKRLAPAGSNLDADIMQSECKQQDGYLSTEYTIILCLDKEINYEVEGSGISYYETEKDLENWANEFIRMVLPANTPTQQFEVEEVELSDCGDILEIIQRIEEYRMTM